MFFVTSPTKSRAIDYIVTTLKSEDTQAVEAGLVPNYYLKIFMNQQPFQENAESPMAFFFSAIFSHVREVLKSETILNHTVNLIFDARFFSNVKIAGRIFSYENVTFRQLNIEVLTNN